MLGAGVLAACSSEDGNGGGSSDKPLVVASTNVYGSIAMAVAGDNADVESLITESGADPHSYEASPADAAKVTEADLVVYNGAGYDSFVDDALSNAPDVEALNAVEVFTETTGKNVEMHDHDHGHDHGEEAHDHGAETEDSTSNEHVWYSLPTVAALAVDIADKLAEIDPDNADAYKQNADAFAGDIISLNDSFVEAASGAGHVHFVQTEPIGGHLFDEADFHDMTPAGFTSAIEEGADPSAADFAEMRDLAGDKEETQFLAFNSQTETSATKQIRDAAEAAGVPVVELTETLPEGTDYASWMKENVDAVTAALK